MNYSLWGQTSSPLSSMLNFYNCFLLPWFITISPYGFSFTQKHLYLLTLCGQHQHLKNLFLWLVWKLEHWEWLWASFYFRSIVDVDPKLTNEACGCNIDNRKCNLLFATYIEEMLEIQWERTIQGTKNKFSLMEE